MNQRILLVLAPPPRRSGRGGEVRPDRRRVPLDVAPHHVVPTRACLVHRPGWSSGRDRRRPAPEQDALRGVKMRSTVEVS